MLLTKECDYGIRIIRSLSDGSKKTIDIISVEEKMPAKFAYKIIKKLVEAGYVNSTRGRAGGYHLNATLGKLRLIDIISALDTGRYISDCLRQDVICSFKAENKHVCTVHEELLRIQGVVNVELGKKTMDEILHAPPAKKAGKKNV